MPELSPVSRRTFVATTGTAAMASFAGAEAAQARKKSRHAMVGTGHRGSGMWGAEVVARHGDTVEFVGLCDINPLRVEAARKFIGVSCPTFTDFDRMLDETRPYRFIIKGLERGLRVITEKPMITDEVQCQAVIDAEKRTGNKVIVAFNYRYSPKHRRIKELLLARVPMDTSATAVSSRRT